VRVLNPGPGEIIDRLIVLDLKFEHAKSDQPMAHFKEEQRELYRALRALDGNHEASQQVKIIAQELRHVHRRVWILIDLMHIECSDSDMAIWARETVRLNDRRADLVGKINTAFGLQNRPEKV